MSCIFSSSRRFVTKDDIGGGDGFVEGDSVQSLIDWIIMSLSIIPESLLYFEVYYKDQFKTTLDLDNSILQIWAMSVFPEYRQAQDT